MSIDYTSAGDDDLASLIRSDRGVTFAEKYRQQRGDASVLVENVVDIRTKEEQLTLVLSTYINGLLETAQIFGVTRR